MVTRNYIPGDEWLYYKIYCGAKTADEIITQVILPVSIVLKDQNKIDKFFFIRYSDPDLHLRVRFHFNTADDIGSIMYAMNEGLISFVNSNKVWKVMLDTYKRELERYHPSLIEYAEDLFCIDSETIALFLDLIDGTDGDKIRWMFSFRSIDALLSDFGFSIEQKQAFTEKLKEAFASEFGMNKSLRLQLDQRYRAVKSNILFIMNLTEENAGEYMPLIELLEQRSNRNIKVVCAINEAQKKDKNIDIAGLLSSYIHMLMNRTFRSKQRLHELVIYDFLFRFYTSEIAKEKYRTSSLSGNAVSTQ
ncbi:MAG: thiopeptide-type bacteriocin biosynthesis protein [Bacteroidales bacterium]